MSKIKSIILIFIILTATLYYFHALKKYKNNLSIEKSQIFMDTIVTIKLYGSDQKKLNNIADECFIYMRKLEKILSNYIPDSEISKINKFAGIKPVKVSRVTIDFLKKSIKLCKLTDCYLDISIGQLINLWGFPSGHPHLPPKSKILNALKFKGIDSIIIDEKNSTVFIRKKGILIDVGATAKGFIVDKGIEFLKSKGIKRGVINAGGDLRFIGFKNKNRYWIVGIKDPYSENPNKIIKKIKVGNWSVATSGDYERFFIYKGKRYCHIFNPYTGYPEDYFKSVTVEADTALVADGLATAIFAMGKDYKKFINRFKKVKHFKVYIIKNQSLTKVKN